MKKLIHVLLKTLKRSTPAVLSGFLVITLFAPIGTVLQTHAATIGNDDCIGASCIGSGGTGGGTGGGTIGGGGTGGGGSTIGNNDCIGSGCDFVLSVSPSSQNVQKPGSVNYIINIAPADFANGNRPPVQLQAQSDDGNIMVSVSPTLIDVGSVATLFVSANTNARSGFHTITVFGNNGLFNHSRSASLNVSDPVQQGSAPTVQTFSASSVGQTSAILNGTVNPNGAATSYRFEYGTSGSLGNSTSFQSVGSGNSSLNVSQSLSALTPNTTYYFRVVAQNQFGSANGSILSFTTQNVVQQNPTLVLTPSSASITAGQSQQFRAWYDPDGSSGTQSQQDVTNSTSFSSNNNSIAAYTGSGQFTGVSAGTVTITGVFGGLTATASLSVSGSTGGSFAPTAQTNSATSVNQTSATLNGVVNPNSSATSYRFEYGTTVSLGNTTSFQSIGSGSTAQNVSQSISSLSANTTYYFRVVAQNSNGTTNGSILSFTTQTDGGGQGSAPTAQTNGATGVSQTFATLNGIVYPNGAATSYRFEYGTSGSLGNSTSFQSVGSGNSGVNASQYISGLSANTTYYFRIVAQNSNGTTNGSILSFTTLNDNSGGGNQGSAPTAQTNSATGIVQNSATLNGIVGPNNLTTTYYFEYGTTYSLGNTTGYQTAGSGNGTLNVSSGVSGLNSNTTYYFRVVAQNNQGTTYGSILTFTTSFNGGGGGGGQYYNPPFVQTNNPTNVNQNSATFSAQVSPNGSDTTTYFEYGIGPNLLTFTTGNSFINGYTGSQSVSQSVFNLSPNTTYYVRAVARNNSGFAYGNTISFNTSGGFFSGGSTLAPTVITRQANLVFQNSALLNGEVNPNNGITTAWFEYGTTLGLGLRTEQQPVGTGSVSLSYSAPLTGLLPGTLYYYRAVAQNQYGLAQGLILSFQTTPIIEQPRVIIRQSPPPTVIVTQPAVGDLPCISVVPSVNTPHLVANQEFDFIVTYANNCPFDITDSVIRTTLPREVDFISSANAALLREDSGSFRYTVGTIPRNTQISVIIHARVRPTVLKGDVLIFSSILTFNDNKGRFHSASAYLTGVVEESPNSNQTASLLSAFTGPWAPWLWLLIIVVIFALLFIYAISRNDRSYRSRFEDEDYAYRSRPPVPPPARASSSEPARG